MEGRGLTKRRRESVIVQWNPVYALLDGFFDMFSSSAPDEKV